MLSIKLVWQSLLAALIRFCDNRFQQKPNDLIRILELELENERREKNKLIDIITSIAVPAPLVKEDSEEVDLKPIGVPNWRVRAKALEEKRRSEKIEIERQRSQARVQSVKVNTVEELESELGVVNE
jgi:hypothetical protein